MKETMDIYVTTAIYINTFRTSNVFATEKEARESIESNLFDVWEGYTNSYVVIEKMPMGSPYECKEIAWYEWRRWKQNNEYVYASIETKKPEEYKYLCNFGIG